MKPIRLRQSTFLAAFGFLASTVGALGQTVIGSSPGMGAQPSLSSSGGIYSSGSRPMRPLSSLSSALAQSRPLYQAGPLAVRPHLSYEIVTGTGILRIPGSTEKVTMHTLSPGVALELGTRITADYTLSRVMYSSSQLSDSTSHNARIQGGIVRDALKLNFSAGYGSNSTVLVETGGQTEEDSYSAGTNIAYQLGQRTELELNLSMSDRSAKPVAGAVTWNASDYTLWSASLWLRRHVSQDLSFAAGYTAGYDEIDPGPDMSHGTPQVQVRWKANQKISLSAEYGIERRRTRTSRAETQSNSRYSGSLSYTPFPTTTVSVGVSRSVEPSYFSGQTTQSDGWNVGLQQRLLTRLFLSAGYSQRSADYESAIVGVNPIRDDRYDSYNVRLSTAVFGKGSVAVFYQHGRNRSSLAIYQFNSDQIGAQFSYRF